MRITILEKTVGDNDAEMQIDLGMVMWSVIETTKLYFERKYGTTEQGEEFEQAYQRLYEDVNPDLPEIAIHQMKKKLEPAITNAIHNKTDQEIVANLTGGIIDRALENARKRMTGSKEPTARNTPILPGSQATHSIEFICRVCQEVIDVDPDIRQLILESDEEIDLPTHHDKPIQIKIIQHQIQKPRQQTKKKTNSYDFFETSQVEEMQITSVGIDIGSSTSHLIFSQLDLRREVGFLNMTNRFNIIDRQILFESDIIDTPLLDTLTIDINGVVEFLREQYQKAGYKPEDIDTGAVIVTGETAKKINAADIVRQISGDAGKFVSATAGPNLESMLAAMGSGAAARSHEYQNTILNVDIGGGTSNLAIVYKGKVVDTSCINVGGRLLGIDQDYKIWRIDPPAHRIMEELNISYKVGDIISKNDVERIAQLFAKSLFEVMEGNAESEVTQALMMTDDMDFEIYPIDEIVFSGGVSEMIFGEVIDHRDIGGFLADEIKNHEFEPKIIEPPNKIRATVIGAGSYSLAISGSTISYDESIEFPLTNIPALVVDAKKEDFNKAHVISEIEKAFSKYDLIEGDEIVALYFTDPIYARDMFLPDFVGAIEAALPNSIDKKQLIILVFNTDVAGTIGMALKRETQIQDHFICLDEITLQDGDWIDIGAPLETGDVFPVTVKSLVFN